MVKNAQFRFHPKCKPEKIIKISFADDLMLVCKANTGSLTMIKDQLDHFANASGLRVNQLKGSVIIGGILESMNSYWASSTSIPWSSHCC